MFKSKALLKKRIERLEEDARNRESYISSLHTALRTAKDNTDKLLEDTKALMEENKKLLQENVDLLLRMRKILKDDERK